MSFAGVPHIKNATCGDGIGIEGAGAGAGVGVGVGVGVVERLGEMDTGSAVLDVLVLDVVGRGEGVGAGVGAGSTFFVEPLSLFLLLALLAYTTTAAPADNSTITRTAMIIIA